MPIALAMFDMAATTVNDTIAGRPLVLQSFAESFAVAHITVPWEELNAQRGKDKLEVFRTLLASYGGLREAALEHTAQELLRYFTAQLLRNVERLQEIPGATRAFAFLKERGVFVALGSGFPLEVTQAIAAHMGWTTGGDWSILSPVAKRLALDDRSHICSTALCRPHSCCPCTALLSVWRRALITARC